MDLIATLINWLVVGTVGVILAWLAHGRFQAIDGRFDRVEHHIDRLEERLDARMDGFQASLDAMRSDLTAVALAVGARSQTGHAGQAGG